MHPPADQCNDPPKPRLVGLDLLRFLAIALVLGRHLWPPPETWPQEWRSILLTIKRGGWVGVDLFFVLSGFLVSGLLFADFKVHGRLAIGRFYLRRGWKIYPPFLALTVGSVAFRLLRGWAVDWQAVLHDLAFLQSYWPGQWGHLWSLAVEEHFYLLLPPTLLLVLRWNRGTPEPLKPVLTLAIGVAAVSLILRICNCYLRPEYSDYTHTFVSHLRLDSLFLGVAISYVYHFRTERFVQTLAPWRRWLIAGGMLLLAPAFAFTAETTPFIYTAGFTLFAIGSGMIMTGVLLSDLPRNRLVAALATLGAFSYSIYLWHKPVELWFVPLFEGFCRRPLGFGGRAAAYLIGSIAAGVLMAKAVEVPALRLRDRWFPPRNRGPIEDAPRMAALSDNLSGRNIDRGVPA